MSDPVELLSITGATFRANDIPFAEYDEGQDAWHGIVRPVSWTAMRVITAADAADLVSGSRAIFDPWYPATVGTPPPGAGATSGTAANS